MSNKRTVAKGLRKLADSIEENETESDVKSIEIEFGDSYDYYVQWG